MIRRPPRSPLFPSTTLSRSGRGGDVPARRRLDHTAARTDGGHGLVAVLGARGVGIEHQSSPYRSAGRTERSNLSVLTRKSMSRSEEHTSELQSRQYLVCRLL